MRKLIRASILLCSVITLSKANAWPQAVTPDEGGIPALKVTAPNGAENLLIGSMHIPADGLRQPADSVMDGAKRYVVESVPDSTIDKVVPEVAPEVKEGMEAMRIALIGGRQRVLIFNMAVKEGKVPGMAFRDGDTVLRANWAMSLSKEQIQQLYRNARCDSRITQVAAKQETTVEKLVDRILLTRTPVMASKLASSVCASEGLLSRDDLLSRAATKRGLQPLPLETVEELEKQRSGVPQHIYELQLQQAFQPVYRQALQQAIDSLNSGDFDGVFAATNSGAANNADMEIFNQFMLSNRNHAWMPKLMTYLDAGNSLVNVGASHLSGPDGLVALLRNKGYRIEPILVPAGNGR